MSISDYDFSQMKYPIHKIPDGQLFLKDKFLKELFEATKELTSDRKWEDVISGEQLVRYIVYVYHRKSPLCNIHDIVKRKKTALEICGVDLDFCDKKKDLKPIVLSIIHSQSDFCNHLSFNFLKFENSIKWLSLVRALEAWEDAEYQMQYVAGADDKKTPVEIAAIKTKLYEGIKSYKEDADRLFNEIAQDDAMLLNAVQGHLYIEKARKRMIVPEDYAAMTPQERNDEFKSLVA